MMELIHISLQAVQRPWLLSAWIFASLEDLVAEVLVINESERKLEPMRQFSFMTKDRSVDLLVNSPKAKRAVEKALLSFNEAQFDEDGYLRQESGRLNRLPPTRKVRRSHESLDDRRTP